MTDSSETDTKVHYICQTYVAKQGASAGLQVDKQFEYTSASEAEGRAEREFKSEHCAGADAYMISEDPQSGEVGSPEFLTRLGEYPEFDEF